MIKSDACLLLSLFRFGTEDDRLIHRRHETKFYTGRLYPEIRPLSLKYTILTKAPISYKYMGDHFRDDVQLTMKIFDTVISPILTYGSEVWGVDHDGKLENDPIEFVQTKFIRWLFSLLRSRF